MGLCSGPCEMAEQRFCVDYAKRGTAGCKKCKEKIVKGVCRIGKVVPNPFSESGGDMKEWYHIKCMFEKLERARATTKKIEDLTELVSEAIQQSHPLSSPSPPAFNLSQHQGLFQ